MVHGDVCARLPGCAVSLGEGQGGGRGRVGNVLRSPLEGNQVPESEVVASSHLLTYACPLVTSVCPPVPVNSCSGHLIPATFPRILPTPSAMGSPFLGIPSTLSPKPEHLPPHRLHARDGLRPSFIYRSLGQGHNPTWVRPHCPAGKSGQSVCVPPRCRSHGRQPDVGDRAGHSARPECTWAVLAWAVRVAKCNRLKVASKM